MDVMHNLRLKRMSSDFRDFADALELGPATRPSCQNMWALNDAHARVLSLLPHLIPVSPSEPQPPSPKRRRKVSSKHKVGLLTLNEEEQELILRHCDAASLCQIEQVCSRYRSAPTTVQRVVQWKLRQHRSAPGLGCRSWPVLLLHRQRVLSAAQATPQLILEDAVASARGIDRLQSIIQHGAWEEVLKPGLDTAVWNCATVIVCAADTMLQAGCSSERWGNEYVQAVIAVADLNQRILVAAGAFDPLVHLLKEGTIQVKAKTALSIANLTSRGKFSIDNVASALPPLVQLLSDSSVKESASLAITNIVADDVMVPLALDLLIVASARVTSAAIVIAQIVTMSNSHATAAVAAGGLESLVQLLQATPDAVAAAVVAIANIAIDEDHRNAVIDAGALIPLVQLLSNGTAHTRQHAANTMATICATSDARKDAVMNAGAVSGLVLLLCDSAAEVKEQAARAVANIASGSKAHVAALVAAQAVGALVLLLCDGAAEVQKYAASAIRCIAYDHPGAVIAAGALPRLVQLLCDDPTADATQNQVVLAIINMLGCKSSSAVSATAAGALPSLIRLLTRGTYRLQEHGARAVLCMTYGHRAVVVSAEALGPLVRLLSVKNGRVAEYALRAIANIAIDEDHRNAVIDAGALSPLVQLLSNGTAHTRQHAANTMATICATSDARKDAVMNAGAVSGLVLLLCDSAAEVKEQAARAVANIASGSKAHVAALVAAQAVGALVLLLCDGAAEVQKYAASAIRCIAYDHPGAVIAAGALPRLVQLLCDDPTADATQNQAVQKQAVVAVVHLSAGSKAHVASVVAANALPPLVQLLCAGTCRSKEHAATAMKHISVYHMSALSVAGAFDPLMQLLRSSTTSDAIKKQVVLTMGNLASGSMNGIGECAVMAAHARSPLLRVDRNESIQSFGESTSSFDPIRRFSGKGPATRTNRVVRDRIFEENDPILSFESTPREPKRILF